MNRQALAAIESFAADWAEWMVEMTFQIAVLTAAVMVLAWLCRSRSASFRYALWMVVLVRLAIPPSLSLPTGWGWWLRGETVVDTAPLDVSPVPAPQLAVAPATITNPPEPPPADATQSQVGFAPTEAESAPLPVSVAPPAPAPLESPRPSWAALLLIGWAGVSATLLGLLMLGALRTRQWVRKASRQLDPRLLRILGRARWRLEFTRDVELRNSENCTTPLVIGWLRPVILLPASVPKELDDDELEAVVLHELNHILRRDALANFAQAVLGAIYFFHPLVWWANREIRRLREDACDEMTVAAMEGRRKAYGSALVKVSEILGYAAPPLALGVMESPHPAKRRLGRILDPNLPLADRWSWLSLALVAVLGIVFLPGGPRPAVTLAEDRPGPAASATEANKTSTHETTEVAVVDVRRRADEIASHVDELPPAASRPVLRYRWKPGQSVAYSISIEAEDAEGVETRYGNVSYNVRAADDERATLAVFGTTQGFRRSHPGLVFGPGRRPFEFYSPFETGGPSAFGQERLLTIDAVGTVESIRGSVPLPFAVGDLARLPLIPLPDGNAREWSVEGPVKIELESRDDPFPRSAVFRPAPEVLEARESSQYRLKSSTKHEAVIERRQQTVTLQRVNAKRRMEITGGGEAVFDLEAGVLESLAWNLTLVSNETYVSRETKIKVSCKRLVPAETTTSPETPAPQIDVAQALTDLDSPEGERVLIALRVVRESEPNAERAAIAARLRPFLESQDRETREVGAAAFGRWAGEEDVSLLVDLVADESASVRWAAMDALGRLRAEESIEPIAARLTVGIDRNSASRALTQIGPAAEPILLPFLDHDDWWVRLTVVNVIRDVGGELSLPPLARLAESDPQNNVRTWANLAAESIQKRLASN